MPRGLAIALVYLLLAAAAAGMAWILIPTILAQRHELVRRTPQLAEQTRVWTERSDAAWGIQISALFATAPERLSRMLVALARRSTRSSWARSRGSASRSSACRTS